MSLILHFHPLSSYCQKVLIALYENGTPFETRLVNLGDPESAAAFRKLCPVGKMPGLQDTARNVIPPESSVIIEYLGQHYPGGTALIPADPAAALHTRLADRFYDLYVHDPMQRIVGDKLRPADQRDPYGVAAAKAMLRTSYGIVDSASADMGDRRGLHAGRLRGGAAAVLRQQARAVRRAHPSGVVLRPAEPAAVGRPRLQGGRAVPAILQG